MEPGAVSWCQENNPNDITKEERLNVGHKSNEVNLSFAVPIFFCFPCPSLSNGDTDMKIMKIRTLLLYLFYSFSEPRRPGEHFVLAVVYRLLH